MNHKTHLPLFVVILTLIASIFVISPVAAHGAQIDGASPQPIIQLAGLRGDGSVAVQGGGFTPGGKVYISLYDAWGVELYETRWTTAGTAQFGTNGSVDPALGYTPAGAIDETFANLCGATPMVRVYDLQTDTWSDLLDIDPGC